MAQNIKVNFMKPVIYVPTYTHGQVVASGYIDSYEFAIVSYGFAPAGFVRIPVHSSMYHQYKDLFMTPKINAHYGIDYTEPYLFNKRGHWIGWHYDYPALDWTPTVPEGHKWETEEILGHIIKTVNQLSQMA